MQDFNTPEAGGGASLSRRKFVSFAAAGTAASLPAVALASAGLVTRQTLPHLATGPTLTQAIADYRRGMAEFNAAAVHGDPPEGFDQATYGHPMDVLSEWQGAAVSVQECVRALELVLDELDGDVCDSPMVEPMVRAALAFLKSSQSSIGSA